jgi:hypothetical protein
MPFSPKQTKAIVHARLKSDKVDAVMLARLLKADFLPTVWISGERERYVREFLAHRGKKIARIAVARKLLGTMCHMMKEEIDYEEVVRRGSNAQ